MAQVVRFWPKIRRLDPSNYQIEKWRRSLISKNLTEQSRPGTAAVVRGTHKVRVAIDALDYEYNHDARTQSPRLTAARLQLAVGRRGLGSREQGEQRTQRASFVAKYHAREYTEQQLSSWARMLCLKKYHAKRLGTSLGGQTRV